VTIYRVVEIRGTAHGHILENFYEFIVVESFPKITYKGFVDALLISKHGINEVIYKMFVETKKPQGTTSVRITKTIS
jgi:hypothetical protein